VTITTTTSTSTSLSEAPGQVDGLLELIVDNPVTFQSSPATKQGTVEAIRRVSGYFYWTSVIVSMLAQPNLLRPGLLTIQFVVTVPYTLTTSVHENIVGTSLTRMAEVMVSTITSKGARDLAEGLYVERIDASVFTTTTTTTATFIACNTTCISMRCDECNHWIESGLNCQEDIADTECSCECSVEGYRPTSAPRKGQNRAALSEGSWRSMTLAFVLFLQWRR
jgi:hypothetical protein